MRASRSSLGLGLLMVALLVLLVGSVARAGRIVPGISIDGARIGQSQAAVKRVLGPPPHTAKGLPGSGIVRWDYKAHNHLTVVLRDRKVISLSVTTIPRQGKVLDHTTKGIGLLSKMSAVDKAYPGQCQPPNHQSGAPPACGWQTYWTTRMGFAASGRYGTGWKAPVETISLQLVVIGSREEILAKLQELHDQGDLTDEEYATMTADVLATM